MQADDPERLAEDLDGFPDRVPSREERLGDLVVDDGDVRAGAVLDRREIPPGEDVAAVHLGPGGREPGDVDALEVDTFEAEMKEPQRGVLGGYGIELDELVVVDLDEGLVRDVVFP